MLQVVKREHKFLLNQPIETNQTTYSVTNYIFGVSLVTYYKSDV